jgi:hypothetical protein
MLIFTPFLISPKREKSGSTWQVLNPRSLSLLEEGWEGGLIVRKLFQKYQTFDYKINEEYSAYPIVSIIAS